MDLRDDVFRGFFLRRSRVVFSFRIRSDDTGDIARKSISEV